MQFMSQLLTVKTALKPFVHWHFVQNIKLCPNFFVYFFAKSEINTKKASSKDALILPQQRGGGLHFHVMLCGRGLGTTHTHRPLTTYVLGAKIRTIIDICKHFGLFFLVSR